MVVCHPTTRPAPPGAFCRAKQSLTSQAEIPTFTKVTDWLYSITASLFTRRRQWHPTPVLLPGKSHGWRSLVGCSPWGRYESDTTERLHFHFSLSCIGEGNGNPLQCSCLENPRDGGSWWLPSMGSHRVGHNWSDSAAAACPTFSELAVPNDTLFYLKQICF